jgi:hypothetical protein
VAPDILGVHQVSTANPAVFDKMPAIGIIESKKSPTECKVRILGEVPGLYSGLTPGRMLFVGSTGRLTAVPPIPSLGEYIFVQSMGVALLSNSVLLVPSYLLTRRIG